MKYSLGNKFYHPVVDRQPAPRKLDTLYAIVSGLVLGGLMLIMAAGWLVP